MNKNVTSQFEKLIEIVKRLRGPDGCPWDKEQSHASLLPYFLEEAYEVIESVDNNDWKELKEELGDILLHAVLQAVIAEENGYFSISDSLDNINKKLVRRHPHVFGDVQAEASFHAKQNWEKAKHAEKNRRSRLEGVPKTMPALIRAQRLQQKASYAGFDWEKVEEVWEKIYEEIQELKEAQLEEQKEHMEEEMGDVLFSIVNLARFLDIPAEDALRKTNEKFVRRFSKVEEELKQMGKTMEETSLEEIDNIWNQIKESP